MKGIITALITPFDTDGFVDEAALRQVVRHNIDVMNVDGLYIGGSTGEAFVMSEEERAKVLRIVKEEAGSEVTLIAQIGSLNFEEAIRLGKEAKELKYDAISAITPYYYNFSFEEIYAYYKKLDEVLDYEMIIYSNPSMAGGDFGIDKFRKLLDIPKVIGIKFSNADIAKLERLRYAFPDDLIYFGYDEIGIVGFVLGCDGAIGSTYNVMGNQVRNVLNFVKEGKIDEARMLQHKITSVITKIVNNNLYPTIKEVITLQGAEAGKMKFPFGNLTQEQSEKSIEILKDIEKINN